MYILWTSVNDRYGNAKSRVLYFDGWLSRGLEKFVEKYFSSQEEITFTSPHKISLRVIILSLLYGKLVFDQINDQRETDNSVFTKANEFKKIIK